MTMSSDRPARDTAAAAVRALLTRPERQSRRPAAGVCVILLSLVVSLTATSAGGAEMTEVTQSSDDAAIASQVCPSGPPRAPVVQLSSQPPARLIVFPPLPSQLEKGRVVIRYCTENLQIRPVFGEDALRVSPRIGHLHITVDGASWRWLDASNEPVIVNGLPSGPHTILIELVDPTHKTIDRHLVRFVIPTL